MYHNNKPYAFSRRVTKSVLPTAIADIPAHNANVNDPQQRGAISREECAVLSQHMKAKFGSDGLVPKSCRDLLSK